MTTIEEIVEAVEAGAEEYVIIRDGEPAAVIVKYDDWQAMTAAVRGGEGGN